MRAKFINEKFTEGGDPVKQMGIGAFSKKYVQREIEKMRGHKEEDVIEDFITDLANDEYGAAFDIYLDFDQKEELFWLFLLLGKKRIKVIGFNPDDEKVPAKYYGDWRDQLTYVYDKKIKPLFNKGWEEWSSEDSGGDWEYILIKYDN